MKEKQAKYPELHQGHLKLYGTSHGPWLITQGFTVSVLFSCKLFKKVQLLFETSEAEDYIKIYLQKGP